MRILIFWGYHQNPNQSTSVHTQVNSMMPETIMLAVMTSAAMNSTKVLLSTISVKCFDWPNRLNHMTSIKFFDWPKRRLIQIIQVIIQLRLFHLMIMTMMLKKSLIGNQVLIQIFTQSLIQVMFQLLSQETIRVLLHVLTQVLNQVLIQILVQWKHYQLNLQVFCSYWGLWWIFDNRTKFRWGVILQHFSYVWRTWYVPWYYAWHRWFLEYCWGRSFSLWSLSSPHLYPMTVTFQITWKTKGCWTEKVMSRVSWYVCDQLGKDATLCDLANDDEDNAPNSFLYLKDDRDKTLLEPLWKEFKIPLLDENREPCLDNDGEPITIIAKDPKSLHFTIFLTKPDEHGKQRHAQVVELIGVFDKHLKDHEQQAKALKDLQYWVIYDHPSYLKNWLTSICLHSLKSICSLTPFDGEFWFYQLLYEQQPKKTNNSNSNDIINCNDKLVWRPRTKSSNKKAAIWFLCQQ